MARLIQAEQRSPEWFAARLGIPSASRFGDIMATTRTGYSASRKNYAAELATERLTGVKEEGFTTSSMQWGIDNEPVARLQYSLASGNDVEETGFWVHDDLTVGASPDGLIGEDGQVEIKCPNTATHIETLRKGEVPYQYIWQVQGQMWITGRKWCDFISFDPRLPENAQMMVVTVDRDEAMIERLEKEVKDFLKEVEEIVEFVRNFD